MREDEKRNFLGIVMGGCGRYGFFSICFFFFSFFYFFFWFLFLKGCWGSGDGEGGMFWFRDGME